LQRVDGLGRRWIVTGGIGSGKSTVLDLLGSKGFLTKDADRIARMILESSTTVSQVATHWPEAIEKGKVDRTKLAGIVFRDQVALRQLEELIHPRVREEIRRWAEAAPPEADVAVEVSVPHAVDRSGWTVVVVYAPESLRRRRLLARGMDPRDVDARIGAQPSDQEWLDLADLVLANDDGVDALEAELCRLVQGSRLG
jgi:dephospho-CoA kinase